VHFYPHHIGDFIKKTSFLSNEEVGVLSKLFWLYYDSELPLPDNVNLLSIKVGSESNEAVVKKLLNIFFIYDEKNKFWRNSRCDNEINTYHSHIDYRVKGGKASAEKRKQSINYTSTAVEQTNNQEPLTNNQEPDIYKKQDFETFWIRYPKKVGKRFALKAWYEESPDAHLVHKALDWQLNEEQFLANDKKFIPNPATWISQRRWEDEPTELGTPF
jgi:uncharacterized protein YdaU (DUF1376 family)